MKTYKIILSDQKSKRTIDDGARDIINIFSKVFSLKGWTYEDVDPKEDSGMSRFYVIRGVKDEYGIKKDNIKLEIIKTF